MRQTSVTKSSFGVTDWFPIDRRGTSGDDYLVVVEVDGVMTVDFEFSPQRPATSNVDARPDPTIIIQHDVLKNLNESCASTISVPFQAFRLNIRDYKSGSATATVVQGGQHGN